MPELDKKALTRKRKGVFWTVMGTAGATGAASGVPTTGLEIPKQVGIAVGDVVLMARIFFATVPCTATADTTLGGACSLVSSADALLPGSTLAGARSVWALDQVKVYDGNRALFATQGVFP